MKNAYIHIPFCRQKCKYCTFVSYPKLELKSDYISALKKEINTRYKGEYLETLYFGGGTPSLLTPDEFKEIISHFNTDEHTEITAEFNPETYPILKYPINRISIGCQTFNNDILKIIGRKHTSTDIINVISECKKSKINNINLDFIYGLPYQTINMFESDLKRAISLDVQHISLYGLKIEDGCYFANHRPLKLPDSDMQADMYLKAIEILTDAGFEHYEISNFAKPGYESKHNLNYWENNTYYGFGVAAHGYENKIRYSNTTNIERYIKNPLLDKQETKLSEREILEEEIFLGFRKLDGIDVKEINKKFRLDFNQKYKKILKKYSDFLIKTPKGYKLNKNGILISNSILSEFIEV